MVARAANRKRNLPVGTTETTKWKTGRKTKRCPQSNKDRIHRENKICNRTLEASKNLHSRETDTSETVEFALTEKKEGGGADPNKGKSEDRSISPTPRSFLAGFSRFSMCLPELHGGGSLTVCQPAEHHQYLNAHKLTHWMTATAWDRDDLKDNGVICGYCKLLERAQRVMYER